jgi:hypothetical protein
MKARLVPLYFPPAQNADSSRTASESADFTNQLAQLKILLADEAEILAPVALGEVLPEADAAVFPQMLGTAFRRLEQIKSINLPILVITSEFGTVSMWDWEINNYLAGEGVKVIAPYNLEMTRTICRTLAAKRELKQTHLLTYQDNPGEGFQASIFKRFYWWEDECIERLEEKFGVTIIRKSFKELGAAAKAISDAEALQAWAKWQDRTHIGKMSQRAVLSAVKLYLAVKRDVDADPAIAAAGINCLNESHFSDTTPCLAWNLLYEDQKLVWGCEADLVSMMTKLLIQKTLAVPFMMTNLYPFLMGMAALKHEHIPYFPQVEAEPENHLLTAHCGFFGVVPQSFSTEWTLREKVLAIVDDNATAIDARLPEGELTLVKLMPPFDALSVVEANLTGYAQFTNSDCLNGAVIRVPNGRRLLKDLASHHYILTTGKNLADLELVCQVFGMDCRVIA